jgi:hypothetical protein
VARPRSRYGALTQKAPWPLTKRNPVPALIPSSVAAELPLKEEMVPSLRIWSCWFNSFCFGSYLLLGSSLVNGFPCSFGQIARTYPTLPEVLNRVWLVS